MFQTLYQDIVVDQSVLNRMCRALGRKSESKVLQIYKPYLNPLEYPRLKPILLEQSRVVQLLLEGYTCNLARKYWRYTYSTRPIKAKVVQVELTRRININKDIDRVYLEFIPERISHDYLDRY